MKKEINKHEFLQFIQPATSIAPEHLRVSVAQKIQSSMTISSKQLWAKIFIAHLSMGAVALATCPQFNFTALNDHSWILHLFHQAGPVWCSLLCGIYFFFFGSLFSAIILTNAEARYISRHQWIFFPLMIGISLFFFFLFGSGLFELLTLAWILGGLISLASAQQINIAIRNTI